MSNYWNYYLKIIISNIVYYLTKNYWIPKPIWCDIGKSTTHSNKWNLSSVLISEKTKNMHIYKRLQDGELLLQVLTLTSSCREYYIFSGALVKVHFQWKFRKNF